MKKNFDSLYETRGGTYREKNGHLTSLTHGREWLSNIFQAQYNHKTKKSRRICSNQSNIK